MKESDSHQLDYKFEENPNDAEGRTIIYLDPETQNEIGRDNFSKYILLVTGILHLVDSPNQLTIFAKLDSDGRVSSTEILKKNDAKS